MSPTSYFVQKLQLFQYLLFYFPWYIGAFQHSAISTILIRYYIMKQPVQFLLILMIYATLYSILNLKTIQNTSYIGHCTQFLKLYHAVSILEESYNQLSILLIMKLKHSWLAGSYLLASFSQSVAITINLFSTCIIHSYKNLDTRYINFSLDRDITTTTITPNIHLTTYKTISTVNVDTILGPCATAQETAVSSQAEFW